MFRIVSLFALMGLVACAGADKADSAGTTDGASECENTIENTYPLADATGVYYRIKGVEVILDEADPDATLTVANAAGSTTIDGSKLTYTFDGPLTPSTAYVATVTYCDGKETEINFTTSDVGGSVSDATSLEENTYELSLADPAVRITKPEGIGSLLSSFLDISVLIMVADVDGTNMVFGGALGAEGATPPAQDMCTESLSFPSQVDFSDNPYFELATDELAISVAGFDVTLQNVFIAGTFTANGDAIVGAELQASADARDLYTLIPGTDTPEAACELVGGFGVACEDCDGDGGTTDDEFCLSIAAEGIPAALIDGLVLVEVTSADIAANEACAE